MKILKNYGPFPYAVFLGAFLLFQIQPMIGKYFLPWFGGAPAVWMTCLMFFQLLLLGGYAYAHFLQNLRSRRQVLTHAILLSLAVHLLDGASDRAAIAGCVVSVPCLPLGIAIRLRPAR